MSPAVQCSGRCVAKSFVSSMQPWQLGQLCLESCSVLHPVLPPQAAYWEQSLIQYLPFPKTCSGAVWESAAWHRPGAVGGSQTGLDDHSWCLSPHLGSVSSTTINKAFAALCYPSLSDPEGWNRSPGSDCSASHLAKQSST